MLGRYKTKARVGAVDIGSNAIRGLVLEFNEKNVKEVYSHRIPFRLRDQHSNREVDASKLNSLTRHLNSIKRDFKELNVNMNRVCATSALRESQNKREVLKSVKADTGMDIELIDGREEAMLVYLGIKYFHSFCSDCLLVDLGGGSLEIAVFRDYKLLDFVSLGLGTLKILENMQNPHYIEDIISAQFQKDKKFSTDIIQNIQGGCPFFITGGNARTVLKILGKKPKDDEIFAEMEKKELARLFENLRGLTPQERMTVYNITRNRADVLFPAVAVFSELMNYFDAEVAQVPDLGLKHGIAFSQLFGLT